MPSIHDEADVNSPSPFAYAPPSPIPPPAPAAKHTLTQSTAGYIHNVLSQQMSKDLDPLDSLTEEEDEDDDEMKYRVMPDVAGSSGTALYPQPPRSTACEAGAKTKLRRKFEETSPPAPSKKIKGRQPASAADFGDEQWRDLHAAVQQIALENMARLYELAPSLDPWRPKGRLNEKVRQFFRHARGASPGSMGLTAVELSLSPSSSQSQKSSQGSGPASSQDSAVTTGTMASTSTSASASSRNGARDRDADMATDTDVDTPTSSPKTPTSAVSSQTQHWTIKQQPQHHHRQHGQHHQLQQPRHFQGVSHLQRRYPFEPSSHFAPTSTSTAATSSIFAAMRPCTEPGARKRRLSELPTHAPAPAPAARSAPAPAPGSASGFGFGLGLGLGLYMNNNANANGNATSIAGGAGRMYDGGSGGWRNVGLGAGGARAGVAAVLGGRAAAGGAGGGGGGAAPATVTGRDLKGERSRADGHGHGHGHGHGRGY